MLQALQMLHSTSLFIVCIVTLLASSPRGLLRGVCICAPTPKNPSTNTGYQTLDKYLLVLASQADWGHILCSLPELHAGARSR